LRTVEVAVDDDGDADLVAAGEVRGQVELDEERLEDADGRIGGTESAVGSDGAAVSRQAVIESARSRSGLTRPLSSVTSSGRQNSVSGKCSRRRARPCRVPSAS
jgi:hypothetical protein